MKKLGLFLSVLLIIALAFTGCGNQEEETAEETEVRDTITIGSGFDIDGMDPQNTGSLISMKIVTNIYDTLLKADEDGNLTNQLIESWSDSEDKLTYTFKLKEGVMFHNGEEMKASDAVFSIERGMASPYAGAIFMSVAGAEAVDDYTFTVTLKYPYAPFLYAMATPLASIVSEKAVEEAGDDFFRKPVGTGAYKLVSWEPGNKVVLEGFEDWHLGEVPIKNLVFKVLSDETTSVIALEKGEIDLLLDVSSTDRQKIIDNENVELYERASHKYAYLGFNVEVEPFNDPLVREAVLYALDREGIRLVATEGISVLAKNHLTDTIFGFSPNVTWPAEQDLEKAKDLMNKSNHPDGFSCNVIVRDAAGQKAAQVIQGNIAEIGIDMNIEVLEYASHLDRAKKGDFDLIISSWSSPVADADYSIHFLFHSKMINAMNLTRYNNPKMDDLIMAGELQLDPEKRSDIYEELLGILREDMPSIPLYYEMSTIAADKDLKNVKPSPSSTYYFYHLSW